MIKLIHTKIRNFRQLRDIEISFARESESSLTVILAENGTGKTTLLNALTWSLFGDEGLPSKRAIYRIHPLDWNTGSDGTLCETEVTIRFATTDAETGVERTYDLVRSTKERPTTAGSFDVVGANLVLFEQKRAGYEPVTNPNAFIANRVLPKSLKDVFFIDGGPCPCLHRGNRRTVCKARSSREGCSTAAWAGHSRRSRAPRRCC